jgi:hypothetical protein
MVKINYNVPLYLVQPKSAAENVLGINKNLLTATSTDITELFKKLMEVPEISLLTEITMRV